MRNFLAAVVFVCAFYELDVRLNNGQGFRVLSDIVTQITQHFRPYI